MGNNICGGEDDVTPSAMKPASWCGGKDADDFSEMENKMSSNDKNRSYFNQMFVLKKAQYCCSQEMLEVLEKHFEELSAKGNFGTHDQAEFDYEDGIDCFKLRKDETTENHIKE